MIRDNFNRMRIVIILGICFVQQNMLRTTKWQSKFFVFAVYSQKKSRDVR